MSTKIHLNIRAVALVLAFILSCRLSAGEVTHTFTSGELSIVTRYDIEGKPKSHSAGPIYMCGMTWMVNYDVDSELPVVRMSDDGVYIGPDDDGYGRIYSMTLSCLDHYNCYIDNVVLDACGVTPGDASVKFPTGSAVALEGKTLYHDNYFYNRANLDFNISLSSDYGLGFVLKSLEVQYEDYRPIACPSFATVGMGSEVVFPEGSVIAIDSSVPQTSYLLKDNSIIVNGYTLASVTPPTGKDGKTCMSQQVHLYPFMTSENAAVATALYNEAPLRLWDTEDNSFDTAAMSGGREEFSVKVSRDEHSTHETLLRTHEGKTYMRMSDNGVMSVESKQPGNTIMCVEITEIPQKSGTVDPSKITTEPESDYSYANNRHVFVPREETSSFVLKHSDPNADFNMADVKVHYSSNVTSAIAMKSVAYKSDNARALYDLSGRLVANPGRGIYIRYSASGAEKIVVK